MPTYTFRNKETGEVIEEFCSIAQRQEKLDSGKYEQIINAKPDIISMRGDAISKTSGDYRDLLKRIKKGSGRGNTIKV